MNGFYWLYLAICVFVLMYDFAKSDQKRFRIYYSACSLLILLFVAQDYSVSPDFLNYCMQFEWIRSTDWAELWNYGWEPGFVYFIKIAGEIFRYQRTIVLLLSIFILVPYFRWFSKNSAMPMMSILAFVSLGFFATSMGIFRQWCAMAILIPSYAFIKNRQPIWFVLDVLLAFMFHRTAAVFIVMYAIYRLPVNRKLLQWSGGVAAALAILGRPIMKFLNIFARIPESGNFNGGVTMLVVLWVFVFLAYYFLRDRMDKGYVKLMFMMLLVAATIQPIAFAFSTWARVVWYFSISLTLLIPELYASVCRCTEGNRFLELAQKRLPNKYQVIQSICNSKWFDPGMHLLVCVVLFVWFLSTLDGSVYSFPQVY